MEVTMPKTQTVESFNTPNNLSINPSSKASILKGNKFDSILGNVQLMNPRNSSRNALNFTQNSYRNRSLNMTSVGGFKR